MNHLIFGIVAVLLAQCILADDEATLVNKAPVAGNNFTICSHETVIVDPARLKHNIPLLMYFPCNHMNKYPYMIFAHAMESQDTWYDYVWQALVPQGYSIVYLGSYQYLPSGDDYARDQRYANDWVRNTCAFDVNCPLYNMVVNRSIAAGLSMGGSSTILCGGDIDLGEKFDHTFDAMMPLSGGAGGEGRKSLEQTTIPSIIMSGSHDCIVPATTHADKYYTYIPETSCKFLAVITNATHCHFGQEGLVKDDACELTERGGCASAGVSYVDNIPERVQHQITAHYMSLFMYATLYMDNDATALKAVADQLQADQNNGVMNNIAINCG